MTDQLLRTKLRPYFGGSPAAYRVQPRTSRARMAPLRSQRPLESRTHLAVPKPVHWNLKFPAPLFATTFKLEVPDLSTQLAIAEVLGH